MLRGRHPDFAALATGRLILRPSRMEDLPALFAILGDSEAMQHTHPTSDFRDCRRRVLVHEWHRRRERCAPWTVIRASDRKIIGWGGLFRDPFDPGWGIELGYWLDRSAWGAGYGSELAAASTAFADNVLKLPELAAFARPANLASRRVLEKSGFTTVRYIAEIDRYLFRRIRGG